MDEPRSYVSKGVWLESGQADFLARLAEKGGVSVSLLVRAAVALLQKRYGDWQEVRGLIQEQADAGRKGE